MRADLQASVSRSRARFQSESSNEKGSKYNMGLSDFIWDVENETMGAIGFTVFKVDRL